MAHVGEELRLEPAGLHGTVACNLQIQLRLLQCPVGLLDLAPRASLTLEQVDPLQRKVGEVADAAEKSVLVDAEKGRERTGLHGYARLRCDQHQQLAALRFDVMAAVRRRRDHRDDGGKICLREAADPERRAVGAEDRRAVGADQADQLGDEDARDILRGLRREQPQIATYAHTHGGRASSAVGKGGAATVATTPMPSSRLPRVNHTLLTAPSEATNLISR